MSQHVAVKLPTSPPDTPPPAWSRTHHTHRETQHFVACGHLKCFQVFRIGRRGRRGVSSQISTGTPNSLSIKVTPPSAHCASVHSTRDRQRVSREAALQRQANEGQTLSHKHLRRPPRRQNPRSLQPQRRALSPQATFKPGASCEARVRLLAEVEKLLAQP